LKSHPNLHKWGAKALVNLININLTLNGTSPFHLYKNNMPSSYSSMEDSSKGKLKNYMYLINYGLIINFELLNFVA
jgi:hypothetical protein